MRATLSAVRRPLGSKRRPADYEERSPVPSALLALYGSACYQQLGEAALAQIATPDTTNRWGFDPVLSQQKQGPGPINSTLEMPGPNHRPLSVPINRSLNAAADRSIASSAFFIGAI